MIIDIFCKRTNLQPKLPQAFFVQMFNLYAHHREVFKWVREQTVEYSPPESYIISESIRQFCNEVGEERLKYSFVSQKYFLSESDKHFFCYICDDNVSQSYKLSITELLFRGIQDYLNSEIIFLRNKIPEYNSESDRIDNLSKKDGTKYYNEHKKCSEEAQEQLKIKEKYLREVFNAINHRLKESKSGLAYHNGFFQVSSDEFIEEKISKPFWEIISDHKYKNVEEDLVKAIHKSENNDGDAASYAAFALESMLKILCQEKGLLKEQGKTARNYIDKLNSKKNGSLLLNEEKNELLEFFKIRHGRNHGPGSADNERIELNDAQVLRYIQTAMSWIYILSKR